MKRRMLTLMAAMMALILVLAGCQSVGGVDLNNVLTNELNVQSYEGSQNLSIELTSDGKETAGEPDLSILNGLNIALTDIKVQDRQHASMNGELKYGKGSIPFQISVTDKEMAVLVQGASKPVVFDISSLLAGEEGAMGSGPVDLSSMGDPTQLIQNVAPLLVPYLPNPSVVKVEPASITVNGEALIVKQVHVEFKGSELKDFVKKLIENLLADQEGLAKLTDQILKQVLGDQYSPLMASFAANEVKQMLEDTLANLDETFNDEGLKELASDDIGLKLDLYVDGDLQVRRVGYEMSLFMQTDASVKEGFKVSGTSDIWNINQPVTADVLNTKQRLVIDQHTSSGLARFLNTLDPDSQAYQFLVDELKVTRKHLEMQMGTELPGKNSIHPYIDKASQKTMVPVRYVSENMDADVKWDGVKKQVTVTDLLTGKTLVFTLNSNIVLVDGKAVKIEAKTVLMGDSTYVPARFIAESFGAEVGWDNATRTVSIIRN